MIKIANNLQRLLNKQALSSSYPNFVNHSTDPASPAIGVGDKPPVSMLPEYAARYMAENKEKPNRAPNTYMSPEDYAAIANTYIAAGNQTMAGLGQMSIYGASDPVSIVEHGPKSVDRHTGPSITDLYYLSPESLESKTKSTSMPLSGPLPVTPRSQQLQNSRRLALEYFKERGIK